MSNTNPKPAEEDTELQVPTDLGKALAAAPSAQAVWQDLTPLARWDFIHWVNTAKLAETRKRRIKRTCEMLPTGKRRPCCYSIVPMDLYRALGADAPAKAQWGTLTPIERRNFISWIDTAKDSAEHRSRAAQICTKLTSGKRRP